MSSLPTDAVVAGLLRATEGDLTEAALAEWLVEWDVRQGQLLRTCASAAAGWLGTASPSRIVPVVGTSQATIVLDHEQIMLAVDAAALRASGHEPALILGRLEELNQRTGWHYTPDGQTVAESYYFSLHPIHAPPGYDWQTATRQRRAREARLRAEALAWHQLQSLSWFRNPISDWQLCPTTTPLRTVVSCCKVIMYYAEARVYHRVQEKYQWLSDEARINLQQISAAERIAAQALADQAWVTALAQYWASAAGQKQRELAAAERLRRERAYLVNRPLPTDTTIEKYEKMARAREEGFDYSNEANLLPFNE